MARKNDASSALNGPNGEDSILGRLPSIDTYRTLAAQLREAARAKTDNYARHALFKQADDYEQFADHLEQLRAFHRPATSPPGEAS